MTGVRRTAHWSRNPVIAATSAPPTAASRATWSPRTGRARRSASRIAAHLRIHVRSSMGSPPRPVTTDASVPHRAATSTAATVVPPTLTSPRITRSVPESASSSAIRIPSRRAASASSRVSASSMSIRPLPRRTRWRTTSSGSSPGSQSRPASTIRTVAPRRPARIETGLCPSSTERTSSCAVPAARADTPSAAIPWSAANSTTRGRSIGRTGTRPCAAASHSASSSSRPSAPAGTASRSRRSSASRRTPPSGRSIRSEKSSRFSVVICQSVQRVRPSPSPVRAARRAGRGVSPSGPPPAPRPPSGRARTRRPPGCSGAPVRRGNAGRTRSRERCPSPLRC